MGIGMDSIVYRLEKRRTDFKKNLSDWEVLGIKKYLEILSEDDEEFSPERFGFAYTSSGSYARLNACSQPIITNDEDEFVVDGFALTEGGALVMITANVETEEEVHFLFE